MSDHEDDDVFRAALPYKLHHNQKAVLYINMNLFSSARRRSISEEDELLNHSEDNYLKCSDFTVPWIMKFKKSGNIKRPHTHTHSVPP